MPSSFTGGCACGAIRYECSADPLLVVNCHCRDCQRASGTAYSTGVVVPAVALTLRKGEPKYYVVTAQSGNRVHRGFCSVCGAPLFAHNSTLADVMVIRLGSLDDPSWCKPMVDMWTASAQPWDYMDPDLPKVPTQPLGS